MRGAALRIDAIDSAAIRDGCAFVGSSTKNSEAQASIIGFCVVIEIRRCQLALFHRGQMCEGLLCRQTTVNATNAPSAGEVIHPHCRTECACDLFRDNAVLREDRNHERKNMNKVWCIATQALALT